jgi:copper(I)-binding protein
MIYYFFLNNSPLMKKKTMKNKKVQRFAIAGLTLATFGLAACGDDDTSSLDTTESSEEVTELVIEGQWARTSPAATTTGAAYVTITSPIDDVLMGASVDASIAESVELHEMVMASDDMMMGNDDMDHSSMSGDDMNGDMDGEMKMQQVMEIALPAGTAVELKPGGYHIMFIGLVNPLKTGDTLQLTLKFQKAGDVVVAVPVQEDAP